MKHEAIWHYFCSKPLARVSEPLREQDNRADAKWQDVCPNEDAHCDNARNICMRGR